MKDPSQEDLLGYVLGALDADKHDDLQKKIEQNPQLDDQLLDVKAQLAPLEILAESSGTRPGLARRTCEMVASLSNDQKSNTKDSSSPSIWGSARRESLVARSSWSLTDLLVAGALAGILISLLFPVIAYTKQRSQIAQCGNNLRSIGFALASFSEANNDRFVEIPSEGPLAFAGLFAPVLKEAGFIEDDSWFTCAGVGREQPFIIPSTDQIKRCSTNDQRDHYRRIASGDYGYSLGHMDGNNYISPRNMCRAFQVICADKPSTKQIGGPSENHRGKGQNCLCEDFHVEFVAGNARGDDPIFVNAYNVVGPGVSARDSVIGAGHLSPMQSPHMQHVLLVE